MRPGPVSTDTSLKGKLVSVTGDLTSAETLSDGLYLKPGKYIAVDRKVEMWAWVERTQTKTETKVGGAEETTTTYTYEKDWVEDPERSSDFRYPEGHENPAKTLESASKNVSRAQIGVYDLNMAKVELPETSPLALTADNTVLSGGAVLASEEFIFIGKTVGSSLASPEVGDLRVSYKVLESGIKATVFGALDGSAISSFIDEDNHEIYRVFAGTRAEAVATLHEEFVLPSWILRILGFLAMWIGLSSLFEPISVLLDVLPFLGKLSRTAVGIVTFLVSLVLTILTILISRLLYNPLLLAIVLIAAAGLFIRAYKKKRLALPLSSGK